MMRVALGGIAVVAAGTGIFVATAMREQPAIFADCGASAIAGSAVGGPFTLIDETGATVTETDVITGPSLVYFGYTFCADVCPLDAGRNADAVDLLAASDTVVRPVFITIDPERDTAEVLAQFTDFMHPEMIGLTGSPEQVAAAEAAYKVYAQRAPSTDDFYLMNHSSFTYLVLPGYGVVDYFRSEDTPEIVAERTACYADAV